MLDFFIDLIQGNTNDYKNFFVYIGLYLFSLWFLFSLWVYFDAKKRYESTTTPIILFAAVFILNFPALIFYLIIRPEDDESYLYMHDGHHAAGGINVPLVNFTGENGLEISLKLTVNKQALEADVAIPQMKVNVDFDPKAATNMVVTQSKPLSHVQPQHVETKKTEKIVKENPIAAKAKNFSSKLKNMASTRYNQLLSYVSTVEEIEKNNAAEVKVEAPVVAESTKPEEPKEA